MAVAAHTVDEQHERAAPGDRNREARRGADENRFQDYSALAPEIFTARPRLWKSFFRKTANSPGVLPMTS
jgi:hypothetical protein